MAINEDGIISYLTSQLNPHFNAFSQDTIRKFSGIVSEAMKNIEQQFEQETKINFSKMNNEIAGLRSQNQRLLAEKEQLSEKNIVYEASLRQKDDAIHTQKLNIGTLNTNLTNAKAIVENLQKEKDLLSKRNIEYEEALRQRDAKNSILEQYYAQAQNSNEDLKKENDRLRKEHKSVYNDNIHFQQERNRYEEKIRELEETVGSKKPFAQTAKPVEHRQNQVFNSRAMEDFNRWASSNPGSSSLPSGFKYLSGDLKIRTHQDLQPTSEQTRWICNFNDREKYLFPNPNFFDQMTDISTLYEMNGAMLREKGSNRIKITRPCEMNDKGYINFPGKLDVL